MGQGLGLWKWLSECLMSTWEALVWCPALHKPECGVAPLKPQELWRRKQEDCGIQDHPSILNLRPVWATGHAVSKVNYFIWVTKVLWYLWLSWFSKYNVRTHHLWKWYNCKQEAIEILSQLHAPWKKWPTFTQTQGRPSPNTAYHASVKCRLSS